MSWQTLLPLPILLTSNILLIASGGAVSGAGPRREAVVTWLQHQEGLVRAMRCRYRETRTPTRDEMIPLIRQVCEETDQNPANYTISPASAEGKSHLSNWCRAGIKERKELSGFSASTAAGEISVFDGQLHRRMGPDRHGHVRGRILLPKESNWYAYKPQPFSWLYEEIRQHPFSEVVTRADEFEAETIATEGEPQIRVSVAKAGTSVRWVMLFDKELRLHERLFFFAKSDEPERLWEKHRFWDYKPHPQVSGETIWFPYRAEYHYYMGELPDKTPVEYMTKQFAIESVEFNVDLSDDLFVIDFPADIPVRDDIAGYGTIHPVDRSLPLVPVKDDRNKAWWWAILGAAPLAALVAFLTLRRLKTTAS